MIDIKNRTVLVAGMALSGASSAVLLNRLGARLILHDRKPLSELPEATRKAIRDFQYVDCMGRDAVPHLNEADLVVVSPGLPPDMPLLTAARRAGLPIVAEIELGFQAASGNLVAITGTNGKTTTTALTGALFSDAGRKTHVLGNIGLPYTAHALETSPSDTLVVETAALQLDDIHEYHPVSCAVLNVTPDHLDRYGTMERYAAAKARIFENQTEDDFCVLNYDDPIVRCFADDARAEVLWFTLTDADVEGVSLRDGKIVFRRNGDEIPIMDASEVRIPGRHNLQNAMAAAALGFSGGLGAESIAETLRTFPGVEHRIETVCEKNGILYINDSKGTNPDATQKAMEAMTRPTVLILGGYDKHAEFTELFRAMGALVRHIVVLGETAGKIMTAASECGWTDIEYAPGFDEAVLLAANAAHPGDAVLLSPACASWDMFENFEERGKRFKEIVEKLD